MIPEDRREQRGRIRTVTASTQSAAPRRAPGGQQGQDGGNAGKRGADEKRRPDGTDGGKKRQPDTGDRGRKRFRPLIWI